MPNFLIPRGALALAVLGAALSVGCDEEAADLTPGEVRALVVEAGAATPTASGLIAPSDPLFTLGQALFFDKELSGNRDIACATCHHPMHGSGDGIPLPIGVGGSGLGPDRVIAADKGFIPRNAPDVFARGADEWTSMFWDSRVAEADGALTTPAGADLPDGLDTVLAAQAMFPVTSEAEMRGEPGDNELADATELPVIWSGLTDRLVAIEGYRTLFAAAYPDVTTDELTFAHAASAIAAFEASAYHLIDSPYDRFLAGDDDALTEQQLRGAELFFTRAGCATCHAGALLTDQQHHAIGAPQLGPGKGTAAPEDPGRFLETDDAADRYAFRTPPLRNVELSGPYLHSGAYATLDDAVRHHLAPEAMLRGFDGAELPSALRDSLITDAATLDAMVAALAPELADADALNDDEIDDLVAFLEALTDPAARDMSALVPSSVPSGLAVAD